MLLRLVQMGHLLPMPQSRPMPSIGKRCHELRVPDENVTWRIVYRVDADDVLVVAVFAKKSPRAPDKVIKECKRRLREYDATD